MPSLEGLVTTTDLHGDRAMRITQQRNVRYDDLRVADVMVGRAALDAIDLELMKVAVVGNVVATLKQKGRNHLLVVEGGWPSRCSAFAWSRRRRHACAA